MYNKLMDPQSLIADFFVKKFKPAPSDDALWERLNGFRRSYTTADYPRTALVGMDLQSGMLAGVQALNADDEQFNERAQKWIAEHNEIFNRLDDFMWTVHTFVSLDLSDQSDGMRQRARWSGARELRYELYPVRYDESSLSVTPEPDSPLLLDPLNPAALDLAARILFKETKNMFKADGIDALFAQWRENKIDGMLLTGLFAEDCIGDTGLAASEEENKMVIIDPDLLGQRNISRPSRFSVWSNSGILNRNFMITEPGQVKHVLDKYRPIAKA